MHVHRSCVFRILPYTLLAYTFTPKLLSQLPTLYSLHRRVALHDHVPSLVCSCSLPTRISSLMIHTPRRPHACPCSLTLGGQKGSCPWTAVRAGKSWESQPLFSRLGLLVSEAQKMIKKKKKNPNS